MLVQLYLLFIIELISSLIGSELYSWFSLLLWQMPNLFPLHCCPVTAFITLTTYSIKLLSRLQHQSRVLLKMTIWVPQFWRWHWFPVLNWRQLCEGTRNQISKWKYCFWYCYVLASNRRLTWPWEPQATADTRTVNDVVLEFLSACNVSIKFCKWCTDSIIFSLFSIFLKQIITS